MRSDKIDRQAVVQRHGVRLEAFDIRSPLTLGNGEFAFTADATGLQTFFRQYEKAQPLCTQSQWGWHSYPMPEGMSVSDMKLTQYDTPWGPIGYPTSSEGCKEIYTYGRQNPHRLHLGRIGFAITLANGKAAAMQDIKDIDQKLDIWAGLLTSRFSVEGEMVTVTTAVHPHADRLAARVESRLLSKGRLSVEVDFPGPLPNAVSLNGDEPGEDPSNLGGWIPPDRWSDFITAADWEHPEKHKTFVTRRAGGRVDWLRVMDEDKYFVSLAWKGVADIEHKSLHKWRLTSKADSFEFVCSFSPQILRDESPDYAATVAAARDYWREFWLSGGMVDLGECSDPRAKELERRIVLSQYLTAVNCAGSMPPQETGLTNSSWYGKFNLEMHYCHAYHFALWGREHLLERSMWWYQRHLPRARRMARRQGLPGARWVKAFGPDDWDISIPSGISPLLIWCQPHPISFAEVIYRCRPTRETADQYAELVQDTAEFMAAFAVWDEATKRYVLAPPICANEENFPPRTVLNPTFELAYWRWGLEAAQQWRQRLGMERDSKWDHVLSHLAPLPVSDGVYIGHENAPDTFTKWNVDHPAMLWPFGLLPGGDHVDLETMRRTLHKVLAEWDLKRKSWGCDYPWIAMTAARLGEPRIAIETILSDLPQNQFIANGHNPTRGDLPCFLPTNSALLLAVAMMAGGWKGCPDRNAPGFPESWKVKHEGLRASP